MGNQMASNNPLVVHVSFGNQMASNNSMLDFSFNWKIDWSQVDAIDSTPDSWPRKYFITAYENVAFRWFIQMKPDRSAIKFAIYYDDGPLETIKGVDYKFGLETTNTSPNQPMVLPICTFTGEYDANRGQRIMGQTEPETAVVIFVGPHSRWSVYKITLRIPKESFGYAPPIEISAPVRNTALLRLVDLFNSIQDPASSKLSDAVLISRDGTEFYCTKKIIGQTEPLETMFSDPLAGFEEPTVDSDNNDGNNDGNTAAKIERGYKFKETATASLKALIEYLYTGQSTLTDLTAAEVIEVANAAEQYLLKPLKESCAANLWKRVAIEPESAFEIASFADLHDECKYLKDRAFDVIVENYENLNINPKFLSKRFGGTRGDELTGEWGEFGIRRLCPDIGSE